MFGKCEYCKKPIEIGQQVINGDHSGCRMKYLETIEALHAVKNQKANYNQVSAKVEGDILEIPPFQVPRFCNDVDCSACNPKYPQIVAACATCELPIFHGNARVFQDDKHYHGFPATCALKQTFDKCENCKTGNMFPQLGGGRECNECYYSETPIPCEQTVFNRPFYKRLEQEKVEQIVDEIVNKPETALKLRFVLLENILVQELIEINRDLLGEPKPLKPHITLTTSITGDGDAHELFEYKRQIFTEFAENNAFHGVEKPETRIEVSSNGRIDVYRSGECVQFITPNGLCVLNELGVTLPFYDPKPMFTSTWRKISPREYKITDDEIFDERFDGSTIALGADIAVTRINKLQKDLPEIWEFTLTLNNG